MSPAQIVNGRQSAYVCKTEIRIFLVTLLVLAFFISIGPGRTQGARVMAHAHALLYEGRNSIDSYHWNTIDKAYFNGHYYTGSGPGMGYIAVPALICCDALFRLVPEHQSVRMNERIRAQLENRCAPLIEAGYLSFNPSKNKSNLVEFHASIWFFELFISVLTACVAVMFHRTLQSFGVQASLAANTSILLPLGTILFFYSRLAYSVAPSAFFLVIGFYLINSVRCHSHSVRGAAMRLVLAGAALGSAVTMEYIQIIGVAHLLIYACARLGPRRAVLVAIGGLPLGLLLLWYHYAAFGNALTTPYRHLIPIFEAIHSPGFLGLTYPSASRIVGLAFGLRRGLFVYDPVLLLTFYLVVRQILLRKQLRIESLLVLGLFISYVLFQAACSLVGETWGIGPRYAAVTVPFLLLGSIFITRKIELAAFRWSALLSLVINWLMVQHDIEAMHHVNPLWDALQRFFRSGPSSNLIEEVCAFLHVASPLVTWSIGLVAYAALFAMLCLVWLKTEDRPHSGILPILPPTREWFE